MNYLNALDACVSHDGILTCTRSKIIKCSAILGLTIVAAIAFPLAPARALSKVVATYHYDNLRTGWNSNETTLTTGKCRTQHIRRALQGRARRASRCATPRRSKPTDYRRFLHAWLAGDV